MKKDKKKLSSERYKKLSKYVTLKIIENLQLRNFIKDIGYSIIDHANGDLEFDKIAYEPPSLDPTPRGMEMPVDLNDLLSSIKFIPSSEDKKNKVRVNPNASFKDWAQCGTSRPIKEGDCANCDKIKKEILKIAKKKGLI